MLPADMTTRQWVAHTGLDPRQFQSGTSVYKPARISKTGNAHLRRALFMPALVSVQWEPQAKSVIKRLTEQAHYAAVATTAAWKP